MRPRKEFSWDIVDSILGIGGSLLDCADTCDVSPDTMQGRIKETFGMTFREYRDLKLSKLRINLLKKQIDVAMRGNVDMLKHLGKHLLGQETNINLNVSKEAMKPLSLEELFLDIDRREVIEVKNGSTLSGSSEETIETLANVREENTQDQDEVGDISSS